MPGLGLISTAVMADRGAPEAHASEPLAAVGTGWLGPPPGYSDERPDCHRCIHQELHEPPSIREGRMPGKDHGPSIKKPRIYEALRRKGMSKTKAAKISNSKWGRRKKKS